MMNKMNVLLDSNIRNKFYKERIFHDQLIEEINRFSELKKITLLRYNSTFSVYEEAGLGKLENIDIPTFDEDIRRLEATIAGSEEEAILLFDFAESFLIQALEKIRSFDKYSSENVLKALSRKLPHIDNDVLKERFIADFISGYGEVDAEVLHGALAFEYMQDKFLQSKINPDRRALFLLSLFYHFLADMRSNSLFRSAHSIWTESFAKSFLIDNPEFKDFFNLMESKFRIKSREDFVDNEVVHYAVMGKRKKGARIKFLVLTNDPIENVLYRISLYKFTVQNSIEIGKGLPRPVFIPDMNFGYIGVYQNDKIKWINVASIPPVGAIKDEYDIQKLASKLM